MVWVDINVLWIHLSGCIHTVSFVWACLATILYKQTDSQPPITYEDGVLSVIDDKWLHFVDHLATGVTLTTHWSSCAARYVCWLRFVLHPYILYGVKEDQ